MSLSLRLAWATLALSMLACGSGPGRATSEPSAPIRSATAGDAIWERLPAGADLVLEVDLKRLRANAVVGRLFEVISPPEPLRESDLLHKADLMVLAIYDMGSTAKQLIILRGDKLGNLAMPTLGPSSLALGDPELVRQAEGLQATSRTMAEDRELWHMRAMPMPAEAPAAALRVVTRIGFDARVLIASKLALSDVPVAMSVWADVVDDLAIVAELHSEDRDSAKRLQRALVGLRKRMASLTFLRVVGVSPALLATQVTRSGSIVRLVFVLRPKRLRVVVKRLFDQLERSAKIPPSAPRKPTTDTLPVETQLL